MIIHQTFTVKCFFCILVNLIRDHWEKRLLTLPNATLSAAILLTLIIGSSHLIIDALFATILGWVWGYLSFLLVLTLDWSKSIHFSRAVWCWLRRTSSFLEDLSSDTWCRRSDNHVLFKLVWRLLRGNGLSFLILLWEIRHQHRVVDFSNLTWLLFEHIWVVVTLTTIEISLIQHLHVVLLLSNLLLHTFLFRGH